MRGTTTIELRSGGQAFDITPFVEKLVWNESLIGGGWTFVLEFATENWPEWERLLAGDESIPRSLRIVGLEEDRESSTGWRTLTVDGARTAIQGTALAAKVHGGDRRLRMMQRDRTRAWPVSTVAEIARRIAIEYGLTPDVEETAGREDRWQVRASDWSFLVETVAGAATASGRGDLFVWIDEDHLRCRAVDFTAAADRRHDLATVENRVDRTIITYNGGAVDRAGGATARAVGFDLDAGTSIVFDVDAAAARALPALAPRVPRDPEAGLRVFAVAERDREETAGAALGVWGRTAPRYFGLRLDTRADPTLRPATVLELQANIDERRNAPFFGRFAVLEVEHVVVKGATRTTAVCYRREAFEGETEPAGSSAARGGSRDTYRFGAESRPRTILAGEVIA